MKNTVFLLLTTLIAVSACAQTQSSSGPPSVSSGPAAVPAPDPATPKPTRPCYDMAELACETFYLTNQERVKAGLPELAYSHRAFAMAQEQSEDMDRYHYFDHQRPAETDRPAESFTDRATRFGLAQGVGENIAMAGSPTQTVDLWMHSEGHRKNILNPRYKSFGVGYQNKLYTQDFWVDEEN